MAIFKPSLDDLGQLVTPLNNGELRVAHALRSLDDDWTVYVQPQLGLDCPDFVAVHDRHGVCAIEVKDWAYDKYRLSENGTAEFRNGVGGWTSTDENPRYQAYRYRSTIFEQFFAMPDDGTAVPPSVRAIVVLLNHSTAHARRVLHSRRAPSAQRAIDIRGDDSLADLDAILRGDAPAAPRRESMQRLRRHLAESSMMWELRQPIPMSERRGQHRGESEQRSATPCPWSGRMWKVVRACRPCGAARKRRQERARPIVERHAVALSASSCRIALCDLRIQSRSGDVRADPRVLRASRRRREGSGHQASRSREGSSLGRSGTRRQRPFSNRVTGVDTTPYWSTRDRLRVGVVANAAATTSSHLMARCCSSPIRPKTSSTSKRGPTKSA